MPFTGFFTQPADQFAPAGSNVTFSAEGVGVAGVTYQCQLNGTNMTGATNATLTLTNVQATNQGSYQVIVTATDFGSIPSLAATFSLVLPPQILSSTPQAPAVLWVNYEGTLSIAADAEGQNNGYPLSYGWQFNGTNITDPYSVYTFYTLSGTNDGEYAVGVTNAAGTTNTSWNVRLALPGMVEAWGDDDYG